MTPAERIEEAYTVSYTLWICWIFCWAFCGKIKKRRKKPTKVVHFLYVVCDKLKPLLLILAISATWFTPLGSKLSLIIVFGGGLLFLFS